MAGALSVYLFIVSAILCFFVYRMTNDNDPDGSKKAAKKRAKAEKEKEIMKSKTKSSRGRSILAHTVLLILLSFMCLFFSSMY